MTREISKTPICPPLTSESTHLLNSLLYQPNNEFEVCNALLVFGNLQFSDTANWINLLISEKLLSTYVIISGGNAHGQSEAHEIFTLLTETTKNKATFVLEDNATNTLENVSFSLPMLQNIKPKKLGLVSQWHHSLRAKLSFQKFFPNITTNQYAFPRTINQNLTVAPCLWQNTQEGKDRTWAEYLRVQKYGSRKDIAYPKEIKAQIDLIQQIIFPS